MAVAANPSSVVLLRIYRNLLRAAKPFTHPSHNARVLNCLLSRTGIDDHIQDWPAFIATAPPVEDRARDLTVTYYGDRVETAPNTSTNKEVIAPNLTPQRLFRRLLREVVCAGDPNGVSKSQWPTLVDPTILWTVIRREFRDGSQSQSSHFNQLSRRHVAFTALRELNKKLSYLDDLERSSPDPHPQQAAWHVSPLPIKYPSSYLRPGVFLLAHPHMNDSFFSKTIICLLEHKDDDEPIPMNSDEDEESASKRQLNMPGQTYGIVVNRTSVDEATGSNRTLKQSFEQNQLPGKLADVFGDSVVREGGPVHVALQMLHSLPSSEDVTENSGNSIGGRVIPMIPEGDNSSTALYSDKATYFAGDVFKALGAVEDGRVDRDDIAFFVGASNWSSGQLRSEIEQGLWIPCRGPPEIALTGICEHDGVSLNSKRPLADLWLSMMSACGEDEAKLSHLFYHEEGLEENGAHCDLFDNEEAEYFK